MSKVKLNKLTYKELNEQWLQTEKLLCQYDYEHLVNNYITPRLERNLYNSEVHLPGIKLIEENREALLLYPRGFGKTTFFVESHIIWTIFKNQNIRIAVVSHSYRKAVEILDHIKQYLRNAQLINIFSDILYDKIPNDVVWKENAIRVKQTEIVGNTVEVFGIEQDITGSHYDVIYFDDIVQLANTNTYENMVKVIRIYAAYIPI